MGMTAMLTHRLSVIPCRPAPKSIGCQAFSASFASNSLPHAASFKVRTLKKDDESRSDIPLEALKSFTDDTINLSETGNKNSSSSGNSFFLLLSVAVGAAAVLTIASVVYKRSLAGAYFGIQMIAESSSLVNAPSGFAFKAFGYKILLPECAPGWIYFWLLMAAGCGLFISEEALNIWVGITLSRLLSLDGTWQSFAQSFSANAPYIMSTIFWVYWGVCISDMIPYYLGMAFRRAGASDDVCSKLGIGAEKVKSLTESVQRYGNLIGFVERFSIGVRNPTSFLAGTLGISAECFFGGVCLGGLITVPLQLGIGFLLRDRPVFALATVASVVGVWTMFPYAIAASTALFVFIRRRYST